MALENKILCEECGSDRELITDNSFYICPDCGLCYDRVMVNQRARFFEGESNKDTYHVNNPLIIGTKTLIGHKYERTDASKKSITPNVMRKIKRLKKEQIRTKGSYERAMQESSNYIDFLKSYLPEHAFMTFYNIFSSLVKAKFLRGRNIPEICFTCGYMALKVHKSERNIGLYVKDLKDMKNVTIAIKKIVQRKKQIMKSGLLRDYEYSKKKDDFSWGDVESKLCLSGAEINALRTIYNILRGSQSAMGKQPSTIAGGLIYFMFKENKKVSDRKVRITQEKVAEVINITAAIIRTRVNEFTGSKEVINLIEQVKDKYIFTE